MIFLNRWEYQYLLTLLILCICKLKNILLFFYILSKIFNFILLFIAWIFNIFVAFFVIEYILNRKIIGLSSVITDKEKGDFMQQKIESQNKNNIIPNNTDIIELHNEKIKIEKYKKYQ